MNKCILIGNLTKKPDLRFTQTGKAVAGFTVAVNDYKKSKENATAQFFSCVAWEKSGETIAEYLDNGSKIYVEGPIALTKWTDKEGVEHSKMEITVEKFEFLSQKNKENGETQTESQTASQETADNGSAVGDIPF